MNWDRIEGAWKEFAGRAKQRWADITDDEWGKISGKRDEVSGLIQRHYGLAKDEADREADEWSRDV